MDPGRDDGDDDGAGERAVSWLGPWRHPGRVMRTAGYVALSPLVATVVFAVIVALFATTASVVIILPLSVPLAWLTFVVSRGLARFERSRANALLDAEVRDGVVPLRSDGWLRRIAERLTSGARWKEIVHHLAAFPVQLVGFALALAAWCGSLALVALPAYYSALPGESAKLGLFDVDDAGRAWGLSAVGALGLVLVAPAVTLGVGAVDRALVRGLLGRGRDSILEEEVERLETSRSAAVDAAEAERRRIERDLHDGAQQRLVALAAGLGAAKEKLDSDPEAARVMVADAHEEAKAALKEIRDLVRGIHPVILEDRGLDAALSAVVARAPVPVTLDVQVRERPPATVESAAYFVVNEALTNVARHAQATRAFVSIARAGDRLVVEVRDDGVGGADASLGSGLQGLRDRVAGLGGSMVVVSPPGGPTTISVELPCGS
jgi:signal transduction histidine kinase